jgi:uncharacterized protein (TIGR00369 family)
MVDAAPFVLTQSVLDEPPFHAFLGMELVSSDAEAGSVVLRLPFRTEFARASGRREWHGGLIAALIDIAGDYALALIVGGGVPTINLRTDYLRGAADSPLTATATVLRAGRTIGVVDVQVHDDGGRLIAAGRGCYSTRPG